MKFPKWLKLVGMAVGATLVASCGQGGGGAAQQDDSPEAAAFQFRHGVMEAVSYKVAQMRGMAQGDVPVNEDQFKKDAQDLVVLAGMIPEGFIPNSGDVKGSRALPAIWMNMDDFKQKAKDLQMAAQTVADAAASQGFQGAKGSIQPVGQACGGCHRPYRRSEEE